MLDIAFIRTFGNNVARLGRSVPSYGHYFKALGLIDAYNYMITLFDERSKTHPEVARAPELRSILLEHFHANAHKHIDLSSDRIFQDALLGIESTVRIWQNAGYPSRRTTANYPKRMMYWQSIYEGRPIKVPANRKPGQKAKGPPKPRTGEDIFGPRPTQVDKPATDLYYEVSVKDRSGSLVTYEDVIRKRNTNFGVSPNGLIPFWIVLNYGSDRGSQPGYPPTPGLHFVEDAERQIPDKLSLYANFFSRFMLDALDSIDEASKDFTQVDQWSRSHIKMNTDHVNPFDFALEFAYGLPF